VKNYQAEKGAVVVEGALASGILFTALLNFMLFGIHVYRSAALQYVVDEATRRTMIGDVTMVSGRVTIRAFTAQDIVTSLVNRAKHFAVPLLESSIKVCPATTPLCTTNVGGNLPELIVIRVRQPGSFLGLTLKAESIGRPE
jgi:Flp pilus assembly protein TadG